MTKANCIDVSSWQGDIDFKKVKSDGIEYVILRCVTKGISVDKYFENNYKKAKEAGLRIGVYTYAYATTKDYALKEAASTVGALDGKSIELPVFYDVEGSEIGSVNSKTRTEIIKAFLGYVKDAGFKPGIYCNENWYKTKLDTSSLSDYPYWVAKYGSNDGKSHTKPDVQHELIAWQFSSKGKVDGVTGNVDVNIWYGAGEAIKDSNGARDVDFYCVVSANALNIRKGPGTTYNILGVLKNGDIVHVTKLDGKWGYTPDKSGWISTAYVTKNIGYITITCHSLTIRDEPSLDGHVKGYATKGEEYVVLDAVTSGGKKWYLLSDGNYCSAGDAYSTFRADSTGSTSQDSTSVAKVIAIAEEEVGYLEKKNGSLSYLYDKTANAGSANYTKYGYEMHEIYPSVMDYPAAWCDAFVDWCFYKAYGVSNAKALLGGNFDDYTVNSAQLYKNKNAWYTSNPRPGDQIFFKNSTRICHTGLVVKVSGNTVYTIEGNTSSASGVVSNGGCVRKKSYSISNNNIAGYGRPNYSRLQGGTESEITNTGTSADKFPYMAETTSGLNCRKGDSTSYDVVKVFSSGDKLSVSKSNSSDTWVYVNSTGWVSKKYTKKLSVWNGKVTASTLNVREGSGTSYPVKSTLKNGTKVKITRMNSDATWGFDSASNGWVSLKYIG